MNRPRLALACHFLALADGIFFLCRFAPRMVETIRLTRQHALAFAMWPGSGGPFMPRPAWLLPLGPLLLALAGLACAPRVARGLPGIGALTIGAGLALFFAFYLYDLHAFCGGRLP